MISTQPPRRRGARRGRSGETARRSDPAGSARRLVIRPPTPILFLASRPFTDRTTRATVDCFEARDCCSPPGPIRTRWTDGTACRRCTPSPACITCRHRATAARGRREPDRRRIRLSRRRALSRRGADSAAGIRRPAESRRRMGQHAAVVPAPLVRPRNERKGGEGIRLAAREWRRSQRRERQGAGDCAARRGAAGKARERHREAAGARRHGRFASRRRSDCVVARETRRIRRGRGVARAGRRPHGDPLARGRAAGGVRTWRRPDREAALEHRAPRVTGAVGPTAAE